MEICYINPVSPSIDYNKKLTLKMNKLPGERSDWFKKEVEKFRKYRK
jgi:hypothetical protein